MKYTDVSEDYKTMLNKGAKKIALVKENNSTIVESTADVLKICREAGVLESCGEFTKATELLSIYWQGIGFPVQHDGLISLEAANLLLVVGSITSALGNSEQIENSQESARDYLGQAERFFGEIGDNDGKAKCLNKIAVSYWRNGDLSTARIFLDESLSNAILNETKAVALLNTAMVESVQNRHFSALDFYKRAYKLIGSISLLTEGSIRNGVGLAYKNIGKNEFGKKKFNYFNKAIAEFEGALRCYDAVKNQRFSVSTRNNVGYLYYTIGLLDAALGVLETAKTQAYQLKDKYYIGVICDTLAQTYLAKNDLKKAHLSVVTAINNLQVNENTNILTGALITQGKILARLGRKAEAKESFAEAENKANYIQDRELAAQVRVFALLELFDDYSKDERLSIYGDAIDKLVGVQDKDVLNAFEEIHALIEAGDAPLGFALEPVIEQIALDEKLKQIEREYFEKAIAATGGNQSQGADLLGLSRQTFRSRIEKHYPDLLPKLQQIGQPKKCEIFPSHLIELAPTLENQKLAVTVLENEIGDFRAGDALIIKLGVWEIDGMIALQPPGSASVKIGFLRRAHGGFALESASGELFPFSDAGLRGIIGEVVGFCRRAEYDKYMKRRLKGEQIRLPYKIYDTEKVDA